MNYYIITGASRGIGFHLANQLGGENATLFLLARSEMREQAHQLREKGTTVHTFHADLSRPEGLTPLIQDIFRKINPNDTEDVVLINNAGMLSPMGPIGKHDPDTFLANLQVNFSSAVMMCHLFIQQVQDWSCRKRILNVSSGAANRPYPGWSHYCSTKAGLNMFTSCIHEEQKKMKNAVEAAAYNPGRTDTQMQDEIRKQDAQDFPFVQSFVDAKKDGALNSPKDVAEHMIKMLKAEAYPSGEIIPFR